MTIAQYLTDEHRACDELLADAESAVQRGDWDAAAAANRRFCDRTDLHLRREEEVLFPAFEEATGQTGGPTAVMRGEHQQMRALLPELGAAIEARDGKRYLGLSESLMVLTQQHDMKEEQILYPMAEQMLPDAGAVLVRLQDVAPAG